MNASVTTWSRFFTMPASTKREPALDGIRGVAVTLTFFVHFAGSYLAKYRGGQSDMLTIDRWSDPFDRVLFWLYHSHHGVQFFFTLSGFLIVRMVFNSESFSYSRFLQKRLLRIYPPFLFWLMVCIALPVIGNGRDWPTVFQFVGNLLFLNAIPQTGVVGLAFNNVTWSLFFEFAFYLSFPCIVDAIRRAGIDPGFGLLIGGLALAFFPFLWSIHQTEVFILFFGGALVGLIDRRTARAILPRIPDLVLIAAYLIATTMHTFGLLDGTRFLWVFAIVSALIVLKAAYGEGVLTRALSWRPLVWLGEISFSFYLNHSIAVAGVFTIGPMLPATRALAASAPAHALWLALCGFLASIVLGAVSFAVLERFYFNDRRKHLTLAAAEPSR